jgi:hypothetical protein
MTQLQVIEIVLCFTWSDNPRIRSVNGGRVDGSGRKVLKNDQCLQLFPEKPNERNVGPL